VGVFVYVITWSDVTMIFSFYRFILLVLGQWLHTIDRFSFMWKFYWCLRLMCSILLGLGQIYVFWGNLGRFVYLVLVIFVFRVKRSMVLIYDDFYFLFISNSLPADCICMRLIWVIQCCLIITNLCDRIMQTSHKN